jgi:exodeoxyribonuclease VII large subunit
LLPWLPEVIGVVTSPTGAVIRDILHRLQDRFPRRVLVWPVQGAGRRLGRTGRRRDPRLQRAARGGRIPRPDLLIVARGGGSLEDLWSFNEEIVVRAAADSMIPLISAVGHETDITLIDFAADKRAPTPTAAAEMAVPVRALAAARLVSPQRVIDAKQQLFDSEVRALKSAAERFKADTLQKAERMLERLERYGDQLRRHGGDLLQHGERQVDQLGKLLESYSFHSVLQRGFALVRDQDGHPVLAAADTRAGDTLSIEFADGKIGAKVTDSAGPAPRPAAPPRRRDGGSGNQGSLL